MGRYRKKPLVIEAFVWTGDLGDIAQEKPEWLTKAINECRVYLEDCIMVIETLEGEMEACPGDWIIQGIAGELYPCKPAIFEDMYESVYEEEDHDQV